MRARRTLALSLAGLLVVAGCGGDDDSGSDHATSETTAVPEVEITGEAQRGEVRVSAIDNFFRPEQLKVVAGSNVTWTNDGRNDHNVIPAEESFGFRVDVDEFEPGDAYEFTFAQPGTYRYYCSIHGTVDKGMVGVVQVVA